MRPHRRCCLPLALLLLLCAELAAQNLRLEKTLTVPPDAAVESTAISSKGDFIAAACKDGQLRVWKFPAGELRQALNMQDQRITALRFSEDATLLAAGGDRGGVRIWSVATGKEKLKASAGASIGAIAISPDHSLLAVAPANVAPQLWSLEYGKVMTDLPTKFSGAAALAFSPDGQRLAAANADTEIKIYEAMTGAPRATNTDLLLESFGLAFSPDGKSLYVGGADGTITVIDAASGKRLRAFPKQSFAVGDLLVSPDGKSIAAAYFDVNSMKNPAPVMVWDAATGTVRSKILQEGVTPIGGQFVPDGRLLLTSYTTGKLQVWSTR